MQFLKIHQNKLLFALCLIAITVNLVTVIWYKFVAISNETISLSYLVNYCRALNILAFGSRIILFISGFYLLVISLLALRKKSIKIILPILSACFIMTVSILLSLENIADVLEHIAPNQSTKISALSKLSGKYYWGDGLAANFYLEIKPNGIFEIVEHSCEEGYRISGIVKAEHGVIALLPLQLKFESEILWPVQWGERTYLIEPNEGIHGTKEFLEKINKNEEPRKERHGHFYLREGDEAKNVSGSPIWPPAYGR